MTLEQEVRNVELGIGTTRARLARYRIRTEHQVGDALAIALCRDIVDHAEATLRLIETPVSRTAASTARSAFESSQDVLLLACRPSEFDHHASMAYAMELLEQQRQRERGVAGAMALGGDATAAGTRMAADVVYEEAQRLDAEAPGLGAVLQSAFSIINAQQGRFRHWSGLTRKQMLIEIEQQCPELGKIALGADALYGRVSIMAHPRLRSGDRRFARTDEGEITEGPERDVRQFIIRLALLSLSLAADALDRLSPAVPDH